MMMIPPTPNPVLSSIDAVYDQLRGFFGADASGHSVSEGVTVDIHRAAMILYEVVPGRGWRRRDHVPWDEVSDVIACITPDGDH